MAQVFGEITLEEQIDICDPISESGKEKIQLVSYIQKRLLHHQISLSSFISYS